MDRATLSWARRVAKSVAGGRTHACDRSIGSGMRIGGSNGFTGRLSSNSVVLPHDDVDQLATRVDHLEGSLALEGGHDLGPSEDEPLQLRFG